MANATTSTTTVPPSSDHPRSYDETCARSVRCVARSLTGRHGIRDQDREDVEQDLALGLLQRLPDFDPLRASWRTFVERCVAKTAVSLIRYRRAQCRRPAIDIAAGVPPSGSGAGHDAQDDHEDDGFAGMFVRVDGLPDPRGGPATHLDLKLDLDRANAQLTPFQQTVCRCLRDHRKAAVHGLLGVKRWRVSRAFVDIRHVFAQLDLDPVA